MACTVQFFSNCRPKILSDLFGVKRKVVRRFKSYRLVYLLTEFDQNRDVYEFLNFLLLDDSLATTKSSQANTNDDNMSRSVVESDSEGAEDSESNSESVDKPSMPVGKPSMRRRPVPREQSGN